MWDLQEGLEVPRREPQDDLAPYFGREARGGTRLDELLGVRHERTAAGRSSSDEYKLTFSGLTTC